MKKIFLVLIAAAPFFVACNDSKKKTSEKVEITKEEKTKPADEDELVEEKSTERIESTDNVDKVAAGICECMGDGMSSLSTQSKNILIRASKSDNPPLTMQNELMKIEDESDKQRIGAEFIKFGKMAEGQEMQDCATQLEKKYNLNEKDPAIQKQLVERLEKMEDCKVLAALMNIVYKQTQNMGQ